MSAAPQVSAHPYLAIRQLEQQVQAERRRAHEAAEARLARARAEVAARESDAEARGRRDAAHKRAEAVLEIQARMAALRADSAGAIARLEEEAARHRDATVAAMLRLLLDDAGRG